MLLNNQQTTEKIKKETKICLEINDNESTTNKAYGMRKRYAKNELSSNTNLAQETIKQSNLTPKANRERNTKKIQSQKKKINHEDRSRNK